MFGHLNKASTTIFGSGSSIFNPGENLSSNPGSLFAKKVNIENIDKYNVVIKCNSNALEIIIDHRHLAWKKYYAILTNKDLESLFPKWIGSTLEDKSVIIENDSMDKNNFKFSDDLNEVRLTFNFVFGIQKFPVTLKVPKFQSTCSQAQIVKELRKLVVVVEEKKILLNKLKTQKADFLKFTQSTKDSINKHLLNFTS